MHPKVEIDAAGASVLCGIDFRRQASWDALGRIARRGVGAVGNYGFQDVYSIFENFS